MSSSSRLIAAVTTDALNISWVTVTVVKISSSNRDMASVRFRELKFDFEIPGQKLELQIPPDSKRVELLHVKP